MQGDKGEQKGRLLVAWVIALTIASALYRVAPYYLKLSDEALYLWNFAPVGALALFVGARLRSPYAFLVPLAAMFASDLLLILPLREMGFSSFSPIGTPIIYASFALYVLLGRLVSRNESSPMVIGGAALLAGTQFFLLSNFAVWLAGGGARFAYTLDGLLQCYVFALPFYRNTLAGDLLFAAVFCALFAVAERALETRKVRQPA